MHTTGHKIILALIAAALWANFGLLLFFLSKGDTHSDSQTLSAMEQHLSAMKSDINIMVNGTCLNAKLCQ